MKDILRRFFARRYSYAPVALLTDFGSADSYVASMKGVLSSLFPEGRTIDICHSVAPQNIREAAYLLWSTYRYFPRDTVFVTVVDPGVGSNRRILLLRMASRWFLAPDNGILDFVLAEESVESATSIRMTNSPYILSSISHTFHGRDVFAPVAAYVSRGVAPQELGEMIEPPRSADAFVTEPSERTGSILHIDHFGNIITDVRPVGTKRPMGISLIRKMTIRRWARNYEEAPSGIPFLIIGSSGLLEISLKNDHAARKLKARAGMSINVLWP